jgi:hypothetical protein
LIKSGLESLPTEDFLLILQIIQKLGEELLSGMKRTGMEERIMIKFMEFGYGLT